MKIISGKYRGKTLKTLDGMDTRPTTSRVKESVFSIIQFDIQDADILDLFAGSGQMGIECLSRGANFCIFNDNNGKSTQIIRENLKICDENYKIYQKSYEELLKTINKQFDIILLDPPYNKNLINFSLNLIKSFKLLKKDGIIVAESSKDEILETEKNGFEALKTYNYGSIKITKIKEIN